MRYIRTREVLILCGLVAGLIGIALLVVPAQGAAVAVAGAVLLAAGWAMLAIIAIGGRRPGPELKQLRSELKAHDERQLDRTRRIEAAIEAERAKESRHEYVQEQALDRIESRLREAAASPAARRIGPAPERAPDVLFVTSNGAGLGHLTRLLAVADRMGSGYDIEFLTLSRAYQQVADMGYPIRYFPSAEVANWGRRLWNTTFRSHLQDVFAEAVPKVVVFDGTVVYEGLVDVCRGHDVPLIWVQRGCWKAEAEERYPTRKDAAKVADHVIIPGDYACSETVDVGNGVGVTRVGPIVLTREDEMLSAEDARAELGLSQFSRHILFNLGGGKLSDPETHLNVLREVVATSLEAFEITMVRSPLAADQELPPEINVIQRYPVARYARAFDFVISAAGYNSVQEAAALRIPTILVPNTATQTDDQVRRAESAAEQGWACTARTAAEVGTRAKELFAGSTVLGAMTTRLHALEKPEGAESAARIVQTLSASSTWHAEQDRVGAGGAQSSVGNSDC